MKTWLRTFVREKGLDLEHTFDVDGPSGFNLIPLGCLLECIEQAPKSEQDAIKMMLIRIDFRNGDVMDYFKYLCKAIAQ